MQNFTKKYIEDTYGVALPAGLSNLTPSVAMVIRADHKRMIERVRKILEAGGEPTELDLRRD